MALGKQIRKYRQHFGWTLEELSQRSQIDVGTISALENRDSTRSQYAPAIARAFGLSVEQLLDESQAPTQSVFTTTLFAREPAAHYGPTPAIPPALAWPFRDITPAQFENVLKRLAPRDRNRAQQDIDLLVGLLLERWERAASAS